MATVDHLARSGYAGHVAAGLRTRAPHLARGGSQPLLWGAAVAGAGADCGDQPAGVVRAQYGGGAVTAQPWRGGAVVRPGGLLQRKVLGMPAFPGFTAPSGATRSRAVSAERSVNLYLEESPNQRGQYTLYGFPGLETVQTLTSGPVLGAYECTNGRVFVATSTDL